MKTSLILSFDIYEWWANIVLSIHITSAFRVGIEPQKALILPGCGVVSVLLLVEVLVEICVEELGAQN